MPLFTSYQLNLITIVKQPTPAYQGVTGELTASRILQLAGNNPQALYYLAGPELLVEAFTKELPAHGLDPQRLVTDYFPGYASI
jgi:ferredoxin-NADP reductase